MLAEILNIEYIQSCNKTEEELRKSKGKENHLFPPWPRLKRTILTPRRYLQGSASRKYFDINLYEVNGQSKRFDQRNALLLHESWGGGGLTRRNFRFFPRTTPIFAARRAIKFEFGCEMTPAALGTNPRGASWAVSLKGVGGKADEML